MSRRSRKSIYMCSVGLLLFVMLGGCKKEGDASSSEKPQAKGDVLAEYSGKLAKADLADGKQDKIISKCVACSLNMDGKKENSRKALDYTLYFCTPRCAEKFSEDMGGMLAGLKIPNSTPATTTSDDATFSEMDEKLAQADRLDGAEDKVVTRCASCALRMDGKPEFAIKVRGYTMHFCSKDCADRFGKDTTKSVLDMVIPNE